MLTSTDKDEVELVDFELSLPLEDPSDSPTKLSDFVAAFAIKSPSFVSTFKNVSLSLVFEHFRFEPVILVSISYKSI